MVSALGGLDPVNTGQILIIVVNTLLVVVGFVISIMIKRLYKSIDALYKKHSDIEIIIDKHREDVLANYTSNARFSDLKNDITKRFDRFEDNVLNAIRKIPQP